MQNPSQLDYINQLIHAGYFAEAQRHLSGILETDPGSAPAWALTAWIAPSAEQCKLALERVVGTSRDTSLTAWARRGLLQIEHAGALGEEPPPVLTFARIGAWTQEKILVESEPKTPKERGAGYRMSQWGGGVMISGVLIIVLALLSPTFAGMFDTMPVGSGVCGVSLIVVGTVVAMVGYRRSRQ